MSPTWADIPVDFKKNLVKNLSFMSRHALRSVCHGDRQLVNSTFFRIPLVRIGYKDGKCLIVIYTGVGKFLRLEMAKCKEGTIIHRSENTWDPEKISAKLLLSTSPLYVASSILKSLFPLTSLLEVMELELSPEESPDDVIKNLEDFNFRIQKIIFIGDSFKGLEEHFLKRVCDLNELKSVERLFLKISSQNLGPMINYVMREKDLCGKSYSLSKLSMNCDVNDMVIFMDTSGKQVQKTGRINSFSQIYDNQDPNQKMELDRSESEVGCVMRNTMSSCGQCTNIMAKKDEKKYDELMKTVNCEIGILCKHHATPFDFWYHQNLPRRVTNEPFWDGIYGGKIEDPNFKKELEKLKIKLEKAEKQTGKVKKSSESVVTSWGFRQIPIQNLMSNHKKNLEKKNKKKMKKLGIKQVPEISEDVPESKSEDVHPEDMKPPTSSKPAEIKEVKPSEDMEPSKICDVIRSQEDSESATSSDEQVFNFLVQSFVPIFLSVLIFRSLF